MPKFSKTLLCLFFFQFVFPPVSLKSKAVFLISAWSLQLCSYKGI